MRGPARPQRRRQDHAAAAAVRAGRPRRGRGRAVRPPARQRRVGRPRRRRGVRRGADLLPVPAGPGEPRAVRRARRRRDAGPRRGGTRAGRPVAGRGGDRVSGYSTGMRQRLGIAAALLRSPRLLLLDEPTSGLDPAGARDMAGLVRGLAADGTAVLLSSHLIGDLENVCDAYTVLRLRQGGVGRKRPSSCASRLPARPTAWPPATTPGRSRSPSSIEACT